MRQALLNAARDLCIEVGLDASSTKAIAARAGVNPAMINYYFGGKEALGRAMMRDAIAPLLKRLDAAAAAAETVSTADLMSTYMLTLAANPWLPKIVVREVLPVNGRFRQMFLDELAARAIKLIPQILKKAQHNGVLREHDDIRLVMLSMISLAVFPFLAAPVAEPALGIDLTDSSLVDRLVEHSIDVFERGLGTGAAI